MSKILSATISTTLSFPTVECKAGNCLFYVCDIYNVSIYNRHVSYSSSCQNSAKEPTPPKPTTKTLAFFKVSKPFFLRAVPNVVTNLCHFKFYFYAKAQRFS